MRLHQIRLDCMMLDLIMFDIQLYYLVLLDEMSSDYQSDEIKFNCKISHCVPHMHILTLNCCFRTLSFELSSSGQRPTAVALPTFTEIASQFHQPTGLTQFTPSPQSHRMCVVTLSWSTSSLTLPYIAAVFLRVPTQYLRM